MRRFSIVLLTSALIPLTASVAKAADLPGEFKTNAEECQMQPATPVAASTTMAKSASTDDKGASATVGPNQPAIPLTPRRKFNYFARSSFFPPAPYALSIFSGVYGEATDKDHHRHMSTGDFLADSMTHAARSFAFRATANFFEKFAYATAFKQDPRYFRSDRKGAGRIAYAIGQVFVTRSDGGQNQFNLSFFAGGLTAEAVSNAWTRPEDRSLSRTMSRFGTHIGYRALSNIMKEFFGKR
jgi:hypothetical protein